MRRLLVNAPTGRQEIVEVGEGGSYFDASRVVHDEARDGPLPAATVAAIDAARAAEARRAEIDAALAALDARGIRALRDHVLAIVGTDGKTGKQRLQEIEDQAAVLRAQRP